MEFRWTGFPTSADVVVIGSGLSGALIAHQLLCSSSPSKPKSVVILEARTAASGATGRNGGHIKPDCYRGFSSYSVLHGSEVAKAQCEFEAVNYRETARYIQESNLAEEVDLVQYRSADVYLTPEAWEAGMASYNGFKEFGGNVSEIKVLDKAEAEQSLRIKDCFGAITFPAASLWPYKLTIAVLRKGLDLGLNFHTNTPVTKISPDSSGGLRTSTPRGDIMTAKPLTTSFALITNDNYDYLIQRPGPQKYLIWGGGEAAHPQGLSGDLGDCNDCHIVSEVESYISNASAQVFRDWEEPRESSGTGHGDAVAFSWSGIMGLSKDLLPFVGELPGRPGQYLVGGYHGHGK
ncbi:gamma-glutamylputrescine oxidoreductase [Fusarium beomiforme]|uniref:Gamma-glutamylputrescine oxidoreductase n=1 Tax=Fusarium beomiforme TaxID=44412 RepID=A0A9P5AAL2_9HYPO|nr:gamma-glutamylputrescine oxidoreductase [Fusarium beomiforme]